MFEPKKPVHQGIRGLSEWREWDYADWFVWIYGALMVIGLIWGLLTGFPERDDYGI